MEIKDLNSEELDAQIELFEDRIETMTDYISDEDEPATRSVMQGQLYRYKATLQALREEKQRRSIKPLTTSFTNFLNFVFASSDHIRYENGKYVSGPHGGAGRAVKVEPKGNERGAVLVTMYNLDGDHPFWQNNIQMAPKQMKVIQETEAKIVLRGYGQDMMGSSFADYGLTINKENGKLKNCILHMHDRSVDIEYLP
jgi:hypothetical protein